MAKRIPALARLLAALGLGVAGCLLAVVWTAPLMIAFLLGLGAPALFLIAIPLEAAVLLYGLGALLLDPSPCSSPAISLNRRAHARVKALWLPTGKRLEACGDVAVAAHCLLALSPLEHLFDRAGVQWHRAAGEASRPVEPLGSFRELRSCVDDLRSL